METRLAALEAEIQAFENWQRNESLLNATRAHFAREATSRQSEKPKPVEAIYDMSWEEWMTRYA